MLIPVPTCVFSNHVTLGTSLKVGIVMPPYMGLVRVNLKIHVKQQHRQQQKKGSRKCCLSVVSDSLRPGGLQLTRLLCPWDSPDKNTGVGSHALLQGIFLTQGLNPGLPHCRSILYHQSHQETRFQIECANDFLSSVQFSCSVVSNSLRPHELQHARPPSPSPTPGVHSDSHPSSQ